MATQEQKSVLDSEKEVKCKIGESLWCNEGKNKKMFSITKSNGDIIYITKGSWVIFNDREDKVIIDKIYNKNYKDAEDDDEDNEDDNDIGPIGMSYLPWRYDEKRFASLSWSMKGNQRFIVCYPSGRNTYGMHIDWNTIYLCEKPDNIEQQQIDDLIYNK